MQDPIKGTSVTITRKELYKRAWETPLRSLATEFSVSPRRLIEIFNELEIPYPRPVYWKRKRLGEHVVQLELRQPSPGTPSYILLELPVDKGRKHSTVYDWHSVIAGWREERKNLMAAGPSEWRASELRKYEILNPIFKAVEEHGIIPQARRQRDHIYFEYKAIEIICTLRERKTRVVRKGLYSDYTFVDLEPTGDFLFKIESYFGQDENISRQWKDTGAKRLEALIPEIISALVQAGPAVLRLRECEEEQARIKFEARQRKKDEEVYRRREQCRWTVFVSYAERLHSLDRLRALIAHLERETSDLSKVVGDDSLSGWLQWAKAHLNAFDPLLIGAESIFSEIARTTDQCTSSLPSDSN